MLTAKQEKFAQNIAIEEMNQADAYRAAYDTSNMSNKTVHEKASILANNDKVRARILELRDEAMTTKVMSAQRRRERLSELAEGKDPNVVMKAIDLLNKMTGEYTQKVQATVTYEDSLREVVGGDEY